MLIASVTTTGRRIGRIVPTLESVRSGQRQPDKLILWLNRDATPVAPGVREAEVPSAVYDLCEVRWCDNYGPATKLLPAMLAFPGDDVATLDDDVLYPPWWLDLLTQGTTQHPRRIVCCRARRVIEGSYNQWPLVKHRAGPSRDLVPTGVHGVLYPPNSLRPEAFDRDLLRRYSLPNDDLWFAAMRWHDPVVVQRNGRLTDRRLRGPRLSRRNCSGRNDHILRALSDQFGPWCPWHKEQSNGNHAAI